MTALMVVGSILLLLLLLLLAPVSVEAAAKDGALSARARYLFFRRDLSPDALLKMAEKKAPAKETEKEPEEKEAKPKPKTADTAKAVWELVKSSRRGMGILRRHLIVSRVEVYVCVGGEDAHQTALRYSRVCSLIVAALDVLGVLFVLKTPKVGVLPDFTKTQTRYELSLRAAIRPLFVLGAGAGVLIAFLKRQLRKPAQSPKTPQPVK